jgi:hypothetical protein
MPPYHVIVSVRGIDVRAWPAHLNLAPRDEKGAACELRIPIGHMSRGKSRRVMVTNVPVACELLAVDLAFAITMEVPGRNIRVHYLSPRAESGQPAPDIRALLRHVQQGTRRYEVSMLPLVEDLQAFDITEPTPGHVGR